MSRSARAASGFAASIVQYCTQIAVQILLAPLVLKIAGRETLGAYAAIMQTLSFLALVDIAGSWSLERFLGQASGLADNGTRFRNVFTTARTLLLCTNCLFAVLVVGFSFFIARVFHLSDSVAVQARHALYVIASWAVIRTPLAAYQNASIATQDIAATNYIGAFAGVLRTSASLLFVLSGAGLFGLMLSGTVAEACGDLLYSRRFKSKHPDLAPAWGIPDRALLREMLGFASHAAVLNLGNMLFFSSGSIVAGATNGAAATSNFYVSQMPTMTIYNMMYRLTEAATPAINELHGRKEKDRVRAAFITLSRILLFLTLPLALGVYMFNFDIVCTWVGPGQYAGSLMTTCLALYCVVNAIQKLSILFAFVFGWMRILSISSILQGVANFGLAYYLGRRVGLGGITLALVITLVPQLFLLLRKLGTELDLNIFGHLISCGLKALLPLAVACGVAYTVHLHVVISLHRYFGLLAEVSAFSLAYLLLAWRLYLDEQDRSLIKTQLLPIRKALNAGVSRMKIHNAG
jgi:O-antigen/teichoic acid export membrane protein